MTVPAQPNTRTEAVGNGISTVFAFEFLCLEARDLQVSMDGEVVPSAQYAVSGLGQHQGGAVTFFAAPASGVKILMELAVVADRQNDYQDFGDLFAGTVNFDFDRIWLAIQSAVGNLRRALRLGPYDADGSGSYRANGNRISNLGDPIASRDAVHRQWVDARISEAAIDGAGEFVVERLADPIDPDNGGAMIAIPTPAGGTTLDEWTGRRLSLKDFGAVMDGVTDDSAAISAAAASGRAIYYDEGVAQNVTGAEPAVRYGPGFIRRPDGITLPAQPFEHAPDVRRVLSGMELDRLSDTQLRIYTGCCTDSTGRLLMRLTANLTVDISTTGLNGLDTGVPESNAGYQIYMVMNTDIGQVGAVISKAITYAGVTMPPGFTRARKLPWGFVLRGGIMPAFIISGWPKAVTNYTSFATISDWAVAENITATSFAAIDFSAWMPDAARVALVQAVVTHDGVGAAGSAFMRVSGSQGVTGEEIASVSGPGDRAVVQVESRVTSTRTLTFRVTGGAVLSIYMQGYVNVEPS